MGAKGCRAAIMMHDPDPGETFNFLDQLASNFFKRLPSPQRFSEHIQGTVMDGIEGATAVFRIDIGGENKDRRRADGHDLLYRFQAIHDRHVNVHDDQIGTQPGGFFHCLQTVAHFTDDLNGGIASEQIAQHGAHQL